MPVNTDIIPLPIRSSHTRESIVVTIGNGVGHIAAHSIWELVHVDFADGCAVMEDAAVDLTFQAHMKFVGAHNADEFMFVAFMIN